MRRTVVLVLVLVAFAGVVPANAQDERLTLRPYGMVTYEAFSAQTSFNALFGSAAQPFWGAGAELILPKHIYVDVSASRFKKTGERAFIDNGQTIHIQGISDTVTIMPGGTHIAVLSNGQKLQVSRLQSRALRERLLKL